MKPKAVIFDFNGTLFKDSHYHILAWTKLAKELLKDNYVEGMINERVLGAHNANTIQNLIGNTFDSQEIHKISQRKEAIYRELVAQDQDVAKLVVGAIETFELLQKHDIPFTIASASIKENIDFFYAFFNLSNWFDLQHIVYDDGTHETKTTMLLQIIDRLQIPSSEILVVEDSISGYRACIEANIGHIAMVSDTPAQQSDKLNWPQVKLSSLNLVELHALLECSLHK